MNDNNVINVGVTSDGKLTKVDDLPKPGTADWSRLVIRSILTEGMKQTQEQADVVIRTMSDVKLKAFIVYLTGDLVELLGTPQERYHNKGKQRLPKELPDDPELEQWIVYLITDVCLFLQRDHAFIKQLFPEFTKGQLYTFLLSAVDSFNELIQEN